MSTYTIDSTRKIITINLQSAVPGELTDDCVLACWIENASGNFTARYVSPDVVGVIRAFMATQTQNGNPEFPNIEAFVFSRMEQFFQASISYRYPPSVQTAVDQMTEASTAVQTAIANVLTESVIL